MFRSLVSSLFTLLAILLFAFLMLFLWSGSESLEFTRNIFSGDKSTQAILEEHRRAQTQPTQVVRKEEVKEEKAPLPTSDPGEGKTVVAWISIPGFRGDYLEKSEAPFLKKLAEDGAATNKMRPNFPCLTFPSHTTMATGTTPDKHGIVADRLRLPSGEVLANPTDPALLLAEPIWTTATRQSVRTLVHDWPLSQNQTGEHKAAHFLDSYDPESTDEARLNKVLEQWRADSKESADHRLRLVMLRLDDILRQGQLHGPRASETYAAVGATDKLLQTFFDTVQAEWSDLAPQDSNLVVFITTDHGLAELDKNVNIEHLLGPELMAHAQIVAHDAIANLFFKDLPASEGEQKIFISKFDNELSKRIYFRTLKKEDLPADWAYLNPERTGDRVLVLKTGYAFADEKAAEPIFDPSEGSGHFGAFGYPVEESIRMSGQIFIGGFPSSPVSGKLDEAKQVSFHATVCKLLGIEPAPGAATETLPVK